MEGKDTQGCNSPGGTEVGMEGCIHTHAHAHKHTHTETGVQAKRFEPKRH